ncbi:F0F1 ATP synthase subunit delta [Spelaeicoccus albus]|uniref:ATP synthase subunit delta n=1 Tax=Spelaeicoccus albus TaxID=1280376 RepID=A0A7Z0D531_9MICO|nr:F0F1 ATP synthase subunit delta [Spelaeicoccus albus]NYI68971.1 F-type H+-transporting ATPase subunit delta [Spelaeicoccus albus]
MRGASRASMAEAKEHIEAFLTDGEADEQLGTELLQVVTALGTSSSLRRALTDSARSADDRAALASSLFGSKLAGPTSEVVTGLVMSRWSKPSDLTEAVETLGVTALAASAQSRLRLDGVEDDVFRFGRVLHGNHGLQRALSNPDAPAESKNRLVATLVGDKVAPEALTLITQAAVHPRATNTVGALDDYAEILAARRDRDVAYVTAATPMSESQASRLGEALSKVYGRSLVLNIQIDPDLVGGIKIQVGDEMLDGSVATRIEDLRRRLAG